MAETTKQDDMKTLISEQRKELIAAKATDIDMDIAYNLQLKEAITASLFLSPHQQSTSSSQFDSEKSNFISDIFIDEIDKYEQEQNDVELCKNELKRIKRDLNVRLYDNRFANEIANIRDHDWKRNGENFNKPYVSSSGDGDLLGHECFRLYFKGIVFGDVKGIGVAICDSKDNVIFDLSKPLELELELNERDMRSCVMVVDVEGLIEGLNVALALDLKRIVYYCDDFLFHQYVSGKRQPTECNMTNYIKSVNLLHEKFVYCSPMLVAQTDIKFAFKLARAAISSQLTRLAGPSGKDVKVACSICFEDTNAQLMFVVDGCRHRYCSFCMKQHVEVKLLHGDLPKCPHERCKSEIKIDSCQKLLEPKLLEIMSQRVKEATIPASEKVYCPNPTCSILMSKSEVQEYIKTLVLRQHQLGASKCLKCRELFCVDCKVPWHPFMTCEAYRTHVQSNSNNADVKLKSLARKRRWQQCPKCSTMVELAEGCYHITCRCGHQFCYICGAEWKNKKPTCSCVIWDERNIIRDRNARQQQQQQRRA